MAEISGSAPPSPVHSNSAPAAAPADHLRLLAVPSERALVDALRRRFRIRLDGRDRSDWILLDTFDGRFARKGRRLIWLPDVDQSALALANAGDEVEDAHLTVPLPERPEFANELPAGALRDQV